MTRRQDRSDQELVKLMIIRLEAFRDEKYASDKMAYQAVRDTMLDCMLILNRRAEKEEQHAHF